MVFRSDNRATDQLRPVKITPNYISIAEGSCLIELGNTRVVCTATIEDTVPQFLRNSGKGWITAEYGMLPRATLTRTPREVTKGRASGRTHEIQRLIGRSLRAVSDMTKLGERTVFIDCDVIQADGGTRTASICGGYLALHDALSRLLGAGMLRAVPLTAHCAAVSVGIVDAVAVLDLPYVEDSRAEVDMNVVMTSAGRYVEVQGTAEGAPFSRTELDTLLDLAEAGLGEIFALQEEFVAEPPPPRPSTKR